MVLKHTNIPEKGDHWSIEGKSPHTSRNLIVC
jgi:hypothetical protein